MNTNLDTTISDEAVAQHERAHGEAVAALAAAETALVRATEAYDAALGQGRDAARAARHEMGDAEVDRDVARRAVDTAVTRLQEARAAAVIAETERLAGVARGRINEFASALKRDLKAMTGLARRLARQYAEAELARDAAIRAGVAPEDLPGAEQFRTVAGFPREVVKTERVKRFIHPYTHGPIDGEEMEQIRGSGRDAWMLAGADRIRLSEEAVFDRSVILAAQDSIRHRRFVETLMVPGLMADDAPGWTPPDSLSPRAILAHLDALEGAAAPDRSDRRERRVELRRVPASELTPAGA